MKSLTNPYRLGVNVIYATVCQPRILTRSCKSIGPLESYLFASDILGWMKATYGITKRWKDIWKKLNARTVPQNVFEELVKAYSSPDRFYHNLTHIQDCLSIFDQTRSLAVQLEEVELAIWFHDAVYDTRRNDNEFRSAEWAKLVILQSGLGSDVAQRVADLILATRHSEKVTDIDAQLIVDVDLSILGRKSDTFWQYEENIRKEYIWVPESLFREKRIEILQGFLNRQWVYYHDRFREMFEKKARENLGQAILKLRDTKNDIWAFLNSMNKELLSLYQADKQERVNQPKANTPDYKAMRKRDGERRERVMEMVGANELLIAEDYYHGAWIMNHGDTPDDAENAHMLALRASKLGHRPARWLAAASYDRWQMYQGKPQKYGTNYIYDGIKDRLWDVDPATTDEERAAWDVPPLAEQLRKAEEANKHKIPMTQEERQKFLEDAPAWLKQALKRWQAEADH